MKILHMSYLPLITISFLFFCFSILNPVHTLPWPGFFSETSAFIAILLLLPLCFNRQLKVPKITIPFFFILILPLIQYAFGQIFFFSNVSLSIVYMFIFWLAIIIGYSLSIEENKIQLNFNLAIFLAWFLFISGAVSTLFALLQWLNLSPHVPVIMEFVGYRPYANMAQPNHLGTLLNLALFSSCYLYGKAKLKLSLLISSFIFLTFAIALTQSRTGYLIFLSALILVFLFHKKLNLIIKNKYLIMVLIYFLTIISFLSEIKNFLSLYFDIRQTASIVERATTGYERLKIWNQMVHAIMKQPWDGYGWNQTTSAQFSVIDLYHGHEWATSSHNFFLDILVWSGVPIGIVVISFIIYFYLYLFNNVFDLDRFFSFLVVSALGIHSLLEYPLYYSYFLILLGLFCGTALTGYRNTVYQIRSEYSIFIFILGMLVFFGICRDYFKVEDNLFAGRLHAMGDLRSNVELPHHLYFLDNFQARAKWLALYPEVQVNQEQLDEAEKIIRTSLKPYDLYKYAQLMAFNNNKEEALRTLKILNVMYGMDFSYHQLTQNKSKEIVEN
ncbi:MAG: Wzy polymerase domain-containing protein [Acinetobacter sp.]